MYKSKRAYGYICCRRQGQNEIIHPKLTDVHSCHWRPIANKRNNVPTQFFFCWSEKTSPLNKTKQIQFLVIFMLKSETPLEKTLIIMIAFIYSEQKNGVQRMCRISKRTFFAFFWSMCNLTNYPWIYVSVLFCFLFSIHRFERMTALNAIF